METILLHVAYSLMLLGFAIRDMLALRSILMSGQLMILVYALSIGAKEVAFWNFLFFSLNAIQVVYLIIERRPIQLPPELDEFHKKIFFPMTPREFLLFWNSGNINQVKNQVIIKRGSRVERLFLILSGTVDVRKGNNVIARLSRGNFIAEMSFLTGEAATADTIANGPVRFLAWNQEKLRHLDQLNPQLLIKIQNILGKDLITKLKNTSNIPKKYKVSQLRRPHR